MYGEKDGVVLLYMILVGRLFLLGSSGFLSLKRLSLFRVWLVYR